MDATPLPRVTIQFCTQCKWMLRAAYFAQELLSTFSTSLGEVALQPSTGGTFIVHLYTAAPTGTSSEDGEVSIQKHLLWDRKAEGGFPETKELKRRVRDVIDPSRDLGHVDGKKATPAPSSNSTTGTSSGGIITPPLTTSSSASNPTPQPLTQEINPASQPSSTSGPPANQQGQQEPKKEKEVLNSRGKIQIGGISEGEGVGFCRPGEDCEDCG